MAIGSVSAVRGAGIVDLDDDVDPIEYCYQQGWTDGLPVVPPTPDRVAAAVGATGRAGDEIVCNYTERSREVTLEHVAANAVMAGCLPEYTPVVVAIVEAMDGWGTVHAANSSTTGAAIAFIVNGPARTELGMNSRGNFLGPGNRANSTIGRAVRLVQINAMGSVPGAGTDVDAARSGRPILDRSTMGQPGKYAGYHIVENEEDYPTLRPLHVELGFAPEQSVVTIFSTMGHTQFSAHHESTAEEIVDTLSHYFVNSGRMKLKGGVALIIPPECADVFVRDGWSKADIRRGIYEGTERSVAWVKEHGWTLTGGMMDRRGAEVLPGDDELQAAIAASPDDILITVAGAPAGAFVHALYFFGGDVASREVRLPKERS